MGTGEALVRSLPELTHVSREADPLETTQAALFDFRRARTGCGPTQGSAGIRTTCDNDRSFVETAKRFSGIRPKPCVETERKRTAD